ncbi:hypothetical protein JRC04_09965 [Mycolicibacterium sp. S2-37]|uniref:hypothetical protein n=1 Tax=Mycolicibacterium sp. S2-37 TaxID=2810297 RepID=UPI001A93F9E7|nr:hypothetical protein [Mycolicibacterium sp. S2-37]MBO0677788.1 hypothetical protein [Mycolicibacterium sp. S2-37]
MRKLFMTASAALMLLGSVANAQLAQAASTAQTTQDTVVVVTQPAPPNQVQPLDCYGTTGDMGCGPGWFWRDGWRGWACYPC